MVKSVLLIQNSCVGVSGVPVRSKHQNDLELHMQPVPHFTNTTDFTIQRPTALYSSIKYNI